MMPSTDKRSLLDTPLNRWVPLSLENLLVVLLMIMAVVSRFYDLGARTMSHDEINHVVPTYSLYSGNGYRYDPMSHGPIQYHMIALSYALFGDNDFTTRLPAAVLNIVTILVAATTFRRYLGHTGALVAGFLILISPFMLFYGRYARNEAYIVLWGILILYAILRYLEKGENWALFLFTAANALHFTDKATAYMFAGAEFLFLAGVFIDRMSRLAWRSNRARTFFLVGMVLAVALWIGAGGVYFTRVTGSQADAGIADWVIAVIAALAAAGMAALAGAGVALVKGMGWTAVRMERSADMLVLVLSFVLPLASALPIKLMGFTPLDYTQAGILRIAGVTAVLAAIGAALGIWWFRRRWLFHAAVFFIPLILLYSTFFTSPEGLAGGLVGALSYWTEQQAVERGGQPLYYYFLLLIPLYEFLPALGTLVAGGIATFTRTWQSKPGEPFNRPAAEPETPRLPVAALLVYWSIASLALFTYAGEKMPWLTIHISLPMILATGWAVGWLVETIPWGRVANWGWKNLGRAVLLGLFGLLAVQTGRDAFRAAYRNYDNPTEYLVYAHAAPLPKQLYQQIQSLAVRITGSPNDLVVGYDNHTRYPYWWYMRRFSNKIDYDVTPTRDLRRAVVITVGDENLAKLTPVVREDYYEYKGMRLWWPNMDYWNIKWNTIESERNIALQKEYSGTDQPVPEMTIFGYVEYAWKHIQPFFADAKVRQAVLQIWLNNDFTAWGEIRNSSAYTLEDWGVADRMHYYIRKDLASLLWPYGDSAQEETSTPDPYENITTQAEPDKVIGGSGDLPGQFNAPRSMAVAPDGSLYVVDSFNSRIQHINPDGSVIHVWGTKADSSIGEAPGGTFNEPWGIAVGPDGSVFVADTWNYRIQKFTADGRFLKMWGFFGQPAQAEDAFYGPRGLAVDAEGRLYVADTGNKRIVIFSPEGEYLSQFGTPGMGTGELDEPVAVALDSQGFIYITDTWNQRVQVFSPNSAGTTYSPVREWPVDGWYGQSVENKPFIAIDTSGNVTITDPELCRLITFTPAGIPFHVWDGCITGSLNLPSGIAADKAGGIWVSNAGNGTLVHFQLVNTIP